MTASIRRIPAATLLRYWRLLAHYHGGVVNHAELARSLDVSETTSRRYLDLLTGTFMVRQLQPWFANLGKRQVKSPKVYLRDSGLLHALLELGDARALARHPKLGASWEGFALEQALILTGNRDCYFWATHAAAELDLLIVRGDRRVGIEFKRADAPQMTRSLRIAIDDLKLETALIVYPGDRRYALAGGAVSVLPLSELEAELRRLRLVQQGP